MDQLYGFQNDLDVKQDPLKRQEVLPPKKSKKKKRPKSVVREYAETILIALLAALLLRVFVISAYHVSSGSMEDTLIEGDYIFVNKLAYKFSPPKLGDVIVFENPVDPQKDYIKRIVAAGGQTVEVADKILLVDGQIAPIPAGSKHIDSRILAAEVSNRDNFGPFTVPDGQYFVMGDNRDDSQDSRFWGCVDKKYIKGRAIFVYFSYEPDPTSPKWEAPYILEAFQILFHNIGTFSTRTRFERIGATL